MIRENTEGPYIGDGGFLRKGTLDEVATQGSVNTRMGVERAIRYAFELARRRDGRKHVTMVHKTNILVYAGDLWERTFDLVAAVIESRDLALESAVSRAASLAARPAEGVFHLPPRSSLLPVAIQRGAADRARRRRG